MKNVAGVICLVKDLDKVTEFYETLGFKVEQQASGVFVTTSLGEFWFEFLLEDKVGTEVLRGDSSVSSKGAGHFIHIEVEDVDAFYEDMVAKGLQPADQPQDYPWQRREFVLQDPDGYKLVFFSRI